MANNRTQGIFLPKASPSLQGQNKRLESLPSQVNLPKNGLSRNRLSRWLSLLKVGELLRTGLRRMPLLYGFLLESRSLVYRMKLRRKRRYNVYGLVLGPCLQLTPTEGLCMNMRSLACISDIESFLSERPWATIVDQEVYQDAWVKGAEWAESKTGKSVQQISS